MIFYDPRLLKSIVIYLTNHEIEALINAYFLCELSSGISSLQLPADRSIIQHLFSLSEDISYILQPKFSYFNDLVFPDGSRVAVPSFLGSEELSATFYLRHISRTVAWGLFSKVKIQHGSLLFAYAGEMISSRCKEERYRSQYSQLVNYLMVLKDWW